MGRGGFGSGSVDGADHRRRHRLDLLINGAVIVELKAVAGITDIFIAISKSCLRAADRRIGLILNFSRKTLEIKRIYVSD